LAAAELEKLQLNDTIAQAKADPNHTIQLPTNMVTMAGTATDDGNPVP
jgi:hypothetical protein